MLDEGRSRLALIVGEDAEGLATSLASVKAVPVARVGRILTEDGAEPWREPEQALRDYRVLIDVDILFSPEILIDPIRLLSRMARRQPLVAVWPGQISDGVASYSEPGRRDHFESQVPDEALVVRTKTTTFPDQATFEVERVR